MIKDIQLICSIVVFSAVIFALHYFRDDIPEYLKHNYYSYNKIKQLESRIKELESKKI